MAAAASCSSAAAPPAGPGPGPVSAGPGSCEWLLLRDGCLRCDADGLCSLCYHPALNAILAVTARGAIKVIDGTSGATLQASALNGERRGSRGLPGPAARAVGGAGPWQPPGRLRGTIAALRSRGGVVVGGGGPEDRLKTGVVAGEGFPCGAAPGGERPGLFRARGAEGFPLALFHPCSFFKPERFLLFGAEIPVWAAPRRFSSVKRVGVVTKRLNGDGRL